MASPSPNRSIMGVAKRLLELAELAARRARGRLAGRKRAFLGGCLGGADRPARPQRAAGVPCLGSKLMAKHARRKVATIRQIAAILGAPSYLRQVASAWSIAS